MRELELRLLVAAAAALISSTVGSSILAVKEGRLTSNKREKKVDTD